MLLLHPYIYIFSLIHCFAYTLPHTILTQKYHPYSPSLILFPSYSLPLPSVLLRSIFLLPPVFLFHKSSIFPCSTWSLFWLLQILAILSFSEHLYYLLSLLLIWYISQTVSVNSEILCRYLRTLSNAWSQKNDNLLPWSKDWPRID